ncbi:hypothetical protein, variant 1 [Aphanomyces invadans]|uniref:Xylose isomerase-like TIM barrel domain-containing protein n=1 Tax=Aphanomyces invadans TaxID=157072 RepID=A0A024UVK6_9STRA|nr:hypothetical protein, variant 1 [Aphanomyces invadans]ETW09975.1 hypothetical protein, variant 1 [Aphanomyces invadans]|eukprot:XP_008861386.1 hypothetical protein, variant 1 [Aphanomyces invadans]
MIRRSLRVASISAGSTSATAAMKTAANVKKRIVDEIKVEATKKGKLEVMTEEKVKPSKRAKRVKPELKASPVDDVGTPSASPLPSKPKKVSKKDEEKATQLNSYLSHIQARRENTAHSQKLVGAHVSGANGLENVVFNAAKIGARAFAFFTRSHRSWSCKPLTQDTITAFHAAMKRFGYAPGDVVPHGSYLLNCGSPDVDVLQKSREGLLDEVRRCEALGLSLYNFHPGATKNEITVEECLDLIAESIELTLKQTKGVTILVENMSNQGSTIGGPFTHLRGIIDRVSEPHRDRVGVCLDTCHAFAAGWDLRDDEYEKTMAEFDATVGFKYLKAVHLNDSQGEVGCHVDRHEKIGRGHVGLKSFRRLMNDPRFNHIPMILETPYVDDDGYEAEISLLYSLYDKDIVQS